MATHNGALPIVTDGISNLYDAADKNSYVGSGNDWSDIMGDFNLTGLVGGGGTEPTYNALAGGCFDFDGSGDKLQLTHATKFDFTGDFAVECWIYHDDVGNEGGATVWFNTTSLDELQFAVEDTGDNPRVVIASSGGNTGFVSTSNLTDLQNRWSCHTATRIGSDIRYYIDGVSRVSRTDSTAGDNNNAILFGEQSGGNHSLDGKIANIKIYRDKGLTATETIKNFNAQKQRFGL